MATEEKPLFDRTKGELVKLIEALSHKNQFCHRRDCGAVGPHWHNDQVSTIPPQQSAGKELLSEVYWLMKFADTALGAITTSPELNKAATDHAEKTNQSIVQVRAEMALLQAQVMMATMSEYHEQKMLSDLRKKNEAPKVEANA